MTYDEGQSIVRPAEGNLLGKDGSCKIFEGIFLGQFSVLGRGLGPSQAVAWAYQGLRLGLQLLEA